jgi:hypothetical protein
LVRITSSAFESVSPPVSPAAAAPVKFQPVVLTLGEPINSAKTNDCEKSFEERKKRENNRIILLCIVLILIKNGDNL